MPAVAKTDYYKALGVSRNSSTDEIKEAYRRLSLKHHPSKNADYKEKFVEFSEAFSVLSDDQKRAIYDYQGHIDAGFSPESALTLFANFFGTDNVHEASLVHLSPSKSVLDGYKPPRKEPESVKVPVTLEELYKGTIKRVEAVQDNEVRPFQVKIKPGWKNGTKIVYPKDTVFELQELPHSIFRRSGHDLHMIKDISLKSALTSIHFEVKTLDERVIGVYVSDVIHPAFVKKIEGEGMPLSKTPNTKGDLFIHFNVKFPEYINEKQKQILRQAL